jgi:S1-C subfamily serine protease
MFIRNSLISFIVVMLAHPVEGQDRAAMRERYRRIKESTVKMVVDGQRTASGFAVGEDLVVTNFHVIQKAVPAPDDQIDIGFAANIEVELQDGRRFAAKPHSSILEKKVKDESKDVITEKKFKEVLGKDVILLSISEKVLRPLKVGRFTDVEEGDTIYLAGYPFGIDQVIVTRGVLSTKWKAPGNMGQGGLRDVAWLDVSMTTGNSGGPVVVISDKPENDVVIGVANFVLSPFAENAQQLMAIASSTPGNIVMMGVDFKKFFAVVGSAIATQSHGLGGCIAIDYVDVPKP